MAKTIFITGCSSGIGLSSAKLFQSKGWNVVATMRKPDCQSGQELSKLPNVFVSKLDVRDVESIKAAVNATLAKFGHIDSLVNNAGYTQMGLIEAISREKIIEQFDVNVFGVIETIKLVLPHMRKNESVDGSRGTIINVGSGVGESPYPNLALYTASKHALHGLTEAMTYELSSQDIQTKIIIPQSAVASTNFQERGGSEFVGGDESLASYGEFTSTIMSKYMNMGGGDPLTADDVARTIYESVTDKTDRLRYYVGNDPDGIVSNKQKLPQEDYVKFMRKTFGLP